MKANAFLIISLLLFLTGCSGWPGEPYTYGPASAAPSNTPRIQTATPVVLTPTPPIVLPPTDTPTETAAPTAPAPSETPTTEPTAVEAALNVDILGCDTGIDVLHGMGEVTNAYVTIGNATGADVSNMCATLRGLDEGRVHPDKTKCIPNLPVGFEVTFKLTVDTTYQEATPIQVDVTSGETLLARVGEPACPAVGLLLPGAGDMGALRPIVEP